MEPFSVDKSFYEIADSDLKELWDADLDPGVSEFRVCDEDEWADSGPAAVKAEVILHDRLMTDAAIGGDIPIKTEHSYCSIPSSPPPPDFKEEMEEMEDEDEEEEEEEEEEDESDEYYLHNRDVASIGSRGSGTKNDAAPLSVVVVKAEPISGPSSPVPSPPLPPPPPLTNKTPFIYADFKYEPKNFGQSVLKQPAVVFKSSVMKRKQFVVQNVVKLEPSHSGFSLPPTPPSSTCSDGEGNVSPLHPSSPSRRLFMSAGTSQTRQPIQTPLISSQPKGSTGTLFLTEEEKRTLLAEGYPIPLRLPLTKAEEKSLKKIRRKIKNKISAQESRRKKKEYMDALERKVEFLSSENSDFRKKITCLEDTNSSLLSQLTKLQAMISRSQSGMGARNIHK